MSKPKKSLRVTALRFAVSVGLTAGSQMVLSAVFQFPAQPFRMLFIAAVILLAFLLTDMIWLAISRKAKLFVLAGAAVLAVLLWRAGLFHMLNDALRDYITFIDEYNLFAPEPTEFGIRMTLWLTAVASALVCNRFVMRKTGGAAVLFVYLTLAALPFPAVDATQYTAAVLLLFASLMFFFLLRAFLLQRKRCGSGVAIGPYMRVGAPVCAVILLTSLILPYSDSAAATFEIPDPVYDFFETRFDNGIFPARPLISMGISDNVRLGGSVSASETILMTVRAEEPFYLYSGVYDIYTGSAWERSSMGSFMGGWATAREQFSRPFSSAQHPGAAPESLRQNMLTGRPRPLSVTYGRMYTNIVLLPRYCSEFTPLSEGSRVVDADGIMRVSPFATRGFSYQAWAYQASYEAVRDSLQDYGMADYWRNLLLLEPDGFVLSGLNAEPFTLAGERVRWAQDFSVSSSPTQSGTITFRPETGIFTFMDSRGYQVSFVGAHAVPSACLELPDTVTERTRRMAKDLMRDGDSIFDYAARVQHFLSTSYRYNLNMPPLPEGADFVDSFLFELEEGYCTSFASAMAVLLRCAGIPARYCQGFAMDSSRYSDGVYTVTSRDAHAWVEVFLPSAGWLAFDPTAAGPGSDYRQLQGDILPAPSQPDPATAAPEPTPSPEPEDTSPTPPPDDAPSPTPSAAPVPGDEPGGRPPADRRYLTAALAVLAAAALPFVLRAARTYAGRIMARRARGRAPAFSAKYWYTRILLLLRADGFDLMRNETLEEFLERIRLTRPDATQELPRVVALMQRVFYGRGRLNADEVYFMEHAHRATASGLSARWSKPKRLWERYITGRLP